MNTSKILWTEGISKTYPMGEIQVHALLNTDMDVQAGEILCILGPSGSGKSTLLNILGGMNSSDTGKILFQGQEISSYSPEQMTLYRRNKVGFVFQSYNLMPSLTARENIDLARQISQEPLDSCQVLQWVNMQEKSDHFPFQLSGGEQQRIAIARAIVKNPDMLLCDEPTGALDYETGKWVLNTLVEINRKTQKTCIIITHNTAIAKIAHRVLFMRSGRISEEIRNENPLLPQEIFW